MVGAQLQQHSQVPLSALQIQLSDVHHGSPFNDEELDEQQAVVVAQCLKGKLTLVTLFVTLTWWRLISTALQKLHMLHEMHCRQTVRLLIEGAVNI